MNIEADTSWNDDEIVFTRMSPDTKFVFDRMTLDFLDAVAVRAGEEILDIACGRGIDATHLWKRGAAPIGIEPSHVMLEKGAEWLGQSGQSPVTLVRGLAESLPFADNSFDKVVCKGSMDHFVNLEKSFDEMRRVTRPRGRMVVAIANFESISCVIGRSWDQLAESLVHPKNEKHPFWKPPLDHNHKFDYHFLRRIMGRYCRMEKLTGVSMLWGAPHWGIMLERLPETWTKIIMETLHRHAVNHPRFADVLIAVGVPRK